jgi:AbrB family looped-hinge helix DNA binding protein
MKTTVGERGQITIPKAIRDRLGLTSGMVLEIREENGTILAEKVSLEDPISKAWGCLKLDKSTDEILADLRGEV